MKEMLPTQEMTSFVIKYKQRIIRFVLQRGQNVDYKIVDMKKVKSKMMIIAFLISAWVLSWFKFDNLFVKAFRELFNKDITHASYYFIFFCIGAIGDLILFFNQAYVNILFN